MKNLNHYIYLTSAFCLGYFTSVLSASAQIVPDKTLPVNSTVTTTGLVRTINGGTTVGVNLYHSFQDFSVPTNNTAYFNNAPQVQNVLTRVTGNSISNIDGTLKANGNANLFLLNPNGIVFGANAKLDIGGTFVGSTANSFKFADGSEFSATNPLAPPLLTLDITPGLQYGVSKQGATISNLGNLSAGQDLVLNADKLDLQGTLQAGRDLTLQAQDSILVTNGAQLSSSTFGQGNAGNITIKANNSVTFNNGAAISNVEQGAVGNAGSVEISTKTLELLGGSFLESSTFGQGDAGTVKITASDSIKFDGNSAAGSQVLTGAVGNAGGVEISTKTLELLGGSFFSSGTLGQGDAGTVKITASDSIKFDGSSYAESAVRTGAVGKAGDVEIFTKTLELLGGSFLTSSTFGQGNAGTVKITASDSIKFDGKSFAESAVAIGAVGKAGGVEISTKTLELLGGSFLSSSTLGQGNAGTVKITATDSIKFDGKSFAQSAVEVGALGKAGGVEISTKTLELLGSSFLSSNTFGQGDAGTVRITTSDAIKFDGNSTTQSLVGTGAVGNAGSVEISTKTLELLGGSSLSSSTFGQGDAGTVKITASDSIKFDGNSTVQSGVATGAVGKAGGVEISTTILELLGGSFLSSSTFGQGDAGTVKITASDSIKFDGNSNAQSAVEIGAVGKAGSVEISTKTLELLGGSFLTSNTFGQGDAGTVKIVASDSIKFDGNSAAESSVGTGAVGKAGGVEIFTKTLELLGGSFLSSSTFGQGDAGTLKITASDSVKFDGNSAAASVVGTGAVGKAGSVEISTKTLELLSGSFLSSSTFGQGDAGTVKITGTDSIKFDGNSFAQSAVGTGAVGKAGGVEISTKTLELLGGSLLSSSTFGQGNAGTVKITASDSIKFDGNSATQSLVGTGAIGNAGGVEISAKTIELLGGSSLSSSTLGQGDAGTVRITGSDSVLFSGNGSVSSSVASSTVGNAGTITINAKSIAVTDGFSLFSSTFGQGNAGNINITATDLVSFNNGFAFSNVLDGAVGNGGNIGINARSIYLREGSVLQSTISGKGNGGNIAITATDTVSIVNSQITTTLDFKGQGRGGDILINTGTLSVDTSTLSADSSGKGDSGNITVNTRDTINISGNSLISTSMFGEGNAGNISINADSLFLMGSFIDSSTLGKGSAGNITLDVRNVVSVSRDSSISSSTGSVGNFIGIGNGGSIVINTGSLFLTGDSSIDSSTSTLGNAGNITVNARDVVSLDNSFSFISTFVSPTGEGKGGDIVINTNLLSILNGAQITAATKGTGNAGNLSLSANNFTANSGGLVSASTFGSGKAGNIDVRVRDSLTLSDSNTGILASTRVGSTGDGGDIFIDPQNVTLQNGAKISVSSLGTGIGGNITIISNLLNLLNSSSITAETASSNGGNITLNIPFLLLLRSDSQISTTAGTANAGGNGGNISINSGFIVAAKGENSDIFANAFNGNGGNVNITTNGIFGLEFRPSLTTFSDITASSQFGLQGSVVLTTPGIDPSRGLTNLPVNLADQSRQVNQSCAIGGKLSKRDNSFTISGKGGLPKSPTDELSNTQSLVELVNPVPSSANQVSIALQTQDLVPDTPKAIVEANAIIRDSQGFIRVVATSTPLSPAIPQLRCQ